MIMDKKQFADFCADLESGRIRVAEKVDGNWKVNAWIKEAILEGRIPNDHAAARRLMFALAPAFNLTPKQP